MKKYRAATTVFAFTLALAAAARPTPARAEAPPQLTHWDRVLDPLYSVLQSEWWYTIGFLSGVDAAGTPRHFAFMVSVVRAAAYYARPIPIVYPTNDLQVSLLDLDRKTHVTTAVAAKFPDLTTFSTVTKDDAAQYAKRDNVGPGGGLQAWFQAKGADFAVALSTRPRKPQAEFGDAGVVDNGSLGKAVYVSRTRQDVVAPSTVTIGGETIAVSGLAWEDHQLSALHPLHGPIRWNWFAIVLADGSEVMAYAIEDARTGALLKNYAGHVLPSGEVENLDGQFSVTETAHAPYRGIAVPTAWTINLPGVFAAAISHVVPLPDIQTTSGQVTGAYFEGPCDVTVPDGSVAAVWAEHFNGELYDGASAPRL